MVVNAFNVRHDVIVNHRVMVGMSRFLRVDEGNEENGGDERACEAMLEHSVCCYILGSSIFMTLSMSHVSLCDVSRLNERLRTTLIYSLGMR